MWKKAADSLASDLHVQSKKTQHYFSRRLCGLLLLHTCALQDKGQVSSTQYRAKSIFLLQSNVFKSSVLPSVGFCEVQRCFEVSSRVRKDGQLPCWHVDNPVPARKLVYEVLLSQQAHSTSLLISILSDLNAAYMLPESSGISTWSK